MPGACQFGEAMSADNWAECPKCKREFLAKQSGTDTPLREDYEFYLEDFILNIYYHCRCQDCGFEFEFKRQVDARPQVEKP